jgi:threonine synthase
LSTRFSSVQAPSASIIRNLIQGERWISARAFAISGGSRIVSGLMRYVSTRGQTRPHSFLEAIEAGLASDGGLFVPEALPDLSQAIGGWEGLGYASLAAEFLAVFGPEIPLTDWHELTRRAYATFDDPGVAPLRPVDARTHVLELFHGPTLAFKDLALQLLGLLYERQVARSGRTLAVLGATSGDTGSAAIHGCLGQAGINIFILYPAGRIAPLQERQMACTGANNVFPIRVQGTFDDAQRVVKEAFGDTEFAHSVNLSAVNSINIARVLAQSVYYLWAWLRLPPAARPEFEFVVPTGNFGNVFAGWLAQQMGAFPEARFRVATNQNDILYRFFTTGGYAEGLVKPSHAPSMDIQAASNFERFLFFLLEKDPERVRQAMAQIKSTGRFEAGHAAISSFRASRTTDPEIAETIARVWNQHAYLVDPHTACAFTNLDRDRSSVVLATAHPAKFPDLVRTSTGAEPVHPTLEALKTRPLVRYDLPAEVEAVKAFIRSRL